METEIRRAKRKDNGKWVTGYYWCDETNKKHFIISRKRLEMIEINPVTLCRCTGRQDLSGEEVFQGDIIESHLPDGRILAENMTIEYGTYQSYCPVDETFMDSIGFYVSKSGYPDMPLGPLEEYAKVIGNIFDHPELEEKKGNLLVNERKTVTKIIREVREEICTRICKYPERYTPEEWENSAEEICKDCPLDRL